MDGTDGIGRLGEFHYCTALTL